jgi:hypothetical protein
VPFACSFGRLSTLDQPLGLAVAAVHHLGVHAAPGRRRVAIARITNGGASPSA